MLKATFSIISLVAVISLSVFANTYAESFGGSIGNSIKPEKVDVLHWLFRSLGR